MTTPTTLANRTAATPVSRTCDAEVLANDPSILKTARSADLARGGVALAVAIGVSSALSFAVHALASRQLSVADYGGLAAVLALMTAAAVPVGAIQTALTRSAAEVLAGDQIPSGRSMFRFMVPVAAATVAFAAVIARPTASFLNLRDATPVVLGGAWVATVLLGAVGKALLIAKSAHTSVAHAVTHGAIVRLLAAAICTPMFGVTGGIAAAVIGDVAASGIYVVSAWRRQLLTKTGTRITVAWPDAGRALSSQLSLWLFASLAVVIGRRTLVPSESGSFAAMATAAAACLFLPQAVATIVFPRFVADGARRLLAQATVSALAVGMICALIMSVRPDLLFTLFFGPAYTANRVVLLTLCAEFVLLGCLTVLTQYVVARRQAGSSVLWLGLGAAGFLALQTGTSSLRVALALLIPTATVTILVAYRAFLGANPDAGAVERTVPRPAGHYPARPEIDLTAFPSPIVGSDASRSAGDRLREPATLDLSIVIPSFNGGMRLRECVESICDVLDATDLRYEILVMIDGSTDGSERGVSTLSEHIAVELGLVNIGKGAALRRGFARSRGAAIGFIDGDGDIAPHVLVDLVEKLRTTNAWLAVASKNAPGAHVDATLQRRAMSAGYRAFVHWMFDLSVSDTQCGAKMFRREYLARTIDETCEDGFAFDLELLAIGRRRGLTHAAEVPVVLTREGVGTVSGTTAFRVFSDTIRIHRRVPQGTWEPLPVAALAPVGLDYSGTLHP